MLEVKIPSEVTAYKGKLVAGLNARQLGAIVAALVVGVPLGMFGSAVMSEDILLWVVILSVAPIFLWGFIPFKGMRFEEYIPILYNFYVNPQKRVYEDIDTNIFAGVCTMARERAIRLQRIEDGELDEEDFDDWESDYDDDDFIELEDDNV